MTISWSSLGGVDNGFGIGWNGEAHVRFPDPVVGGEFSSFSSSVPTGGRVGDSFFAITKAFAHLAFSGPRVPYILSCLPAIIRAGPEGP